MKIRNQTWIETDDLILLNLREPYWSASQRFGWEQKGEGFGISLEAYEYAKKTKKKIKIDVYKYGKYIVPVCRLLKFEHCIYKARDGKSLMVIPRVVCDRVPEEKLKEKFEEKESNRARLNRSYQGTLDGFFKRFF